MGVHETLQFVQHGGQKARMFVPRTSIFVCILQTVQVSAGRSVSTREFVPRTSVFPRIPETVQVASARRLVARAFVPHAHVLVHVHQALQVSTEGRDRGRGHVPGAADLVGQRQTIDVPVTRGRLAYAAELVAIDAAPHLAEHGPPVAVRVEPAAFRVQLQHFEQRLATALHVDARKRRVFRAIRVPLDLVTRSVRRLEQAGHGVRPSSVGRRHHAARII